jgi:hypothetical protein
MSERNDTVRIERCDFHPGEDDPTAIGLLLAIDRARDDMHVTLFVDPAWLRRLQATLAEGTETSGEIPPGVRLPTIATLWPEDMNREQLAVLDDLHTGYRAVNCDWTHFSRCVTAA